LIVEFTAKNRNKATDYFKATDSQIILLKQPIILKPQIHRLFY